MNKIIDLSRTPSLVGQPRVEIVRHFKHGSFEWSPDNVEFIQFKDLRDKVKSFSFRSFETLFPDEYRIRVCNANLHSFLVAYPAQIPGSWKDKEGNPCRILFPGTIFHDQQSGYFCKSLLYDQNTADEWRQNDLYSDNGALFFLRWTDGFLVHK
jgi:hypothetical protein